MGSSGLRAGVHYPRSVGEMRSWFGTDSACLDYLDWVRWPEGFLCSRCSCAGSWPLGDGRHKCRSCGQRTAVTAGTLFDRRRTPLTVWFEACWMFASSKNGISALELQRALEIGSYATAWAMLQRLRAVLVRPGREPLTGTVEVDETFVGGKERGKTPGRSLGTKKALVVVAVETRGTSLGRVRLQVVPDASGTSLVPFITQNIEPDSIVVTDGWHPYKQITRHGYHHLPNSHRLAVATGIDPDDLTPAVHRVASLLKRWLLGTHQGAPRTEHLQGYLDEFAFRFNRRRSASRGLLFLRLLQLAVDHDPVRYQQLVANPRPVSETTTIKRPGRTTTHPPSLERPAPDRPWRNEPPVRSPE